MPRRFRRHDRRVVYDLGGIWDFAFLGDADPDHVDIHKIRFDDRMAVPGCFDATPAYAGKRGLAALIKTLGILPEYLKNQATASGAVIDYRDWQVPLGRRFRALKLWFVIRHYGIEGLRHHVREHVRLAREFAGWVRADPRFELAPPCPAEPGDVPPRRRRRGQPENPGYRESLGKDLPDPHQTE